MHGNEPPRVVAAAMLGADVILAPTTYAITHTKARLEASKRGARTVIMRSITEDTMIHGAMLADYNEVSALSNRLAKKLSQMKQIRLVTDLGTDVTFNVEGRQGLALGGIAIEPGTLLLSRARGSHCSPRRSNTGKNHRRLCHGWDRSFNQPIQLDVKDGRVISIRGGKEAQELRRLLEGDENAFVVAEFAIGTNPKSRMKGNMAEDKILRGCVM